MGKLINKKSVEPFTISFMAKMNEMLKTHGSDWSIKEINIKNCEICVIMTIFFSRPVPGWPEHLQTDLLCFVAGENGISNIHNEYMPSLPFDFVKYLTDWVNTFTTELLRKRTAYIVSNRIKKELVAKAWAPERVSKWLEAGVALEDM